MYSTFALIELRRKIRKCNFDWLVKQEKKKEWEFIAFIQESMGRAHML